VPRGELQTYTSVIVSRLVFSKFLKSPHLQEIGMEISFGTDSAFFPRLLLVFSHIVPSAIYGTAGAEVGSTHDTFLISHFLPSIAIVRTGHPRVQDGNDALHICRTGTF